MIITELRLWKDCGYTEGSIQVPSLSDTLPSYDVRITDDISPSRERVFSEMRLRMSYDDLYDMSYLRATYEMGNGTTITLYGWIDDVSVMGDTETPVTSVSWHVDLWRTYNNLVNYGSGFVKRRPESGTVPPQNYPYIYQELSSTRYELTPKDCGLWWFIINVNEEINDSKAVYQAMYVIPLDPNLRSYTLETSNPIPDLPWGDADLNESGPAINTYSVLMGLWDEQLQLDPERITNAFISPYAPMEVTISGTTITAEECSLVGQTVKAFRVTHNNNRERVHTASLQRVVTDDVNTFVVTGFDGEVVHVMPYGLVAGGQYTSRLVVSAASAYIQIRLDGIASHAEGLCITVPCPSVDVSANSWSSYVYSGARERDHTQAFLDVARDALAPGVDLFGNLGMTQYEYTTGVAPIMHMAGARPGDGWKGRSMLGMLESDVAHLTAQTAGRLGLGSALLNGAYQAAMTVVNDRAHAKQADGLLIAGGSFDIIFHGDTICVRKLVIDNYSKSQRQHYIDTYGVTVQEAYSDCEYLISAGGPLMIDNLEVTGDVPAPAKVFIRDMFRKGVILK